MQSCIYQGTIRHRRYRPRRHDFTYRMFMLYLDLDEIETVLPESLVWSTRRPALFRFKREDYFGNPGMALKQSIEEAIQERAGIVTNGPIRMLTHVRQFGYCFNPVTFYYCYDRSGERVETVVADITNTPWNEKYAYILTPEKNLGGDDLLRFQMPKDFHVSPFMDMRHDYDWRFSQPGERLNVFFENWQDDSLYFDATLSMRRSELTGPALVKMAGLYPLMTLRVIGGIYWQAMRLFLKRVPFHPHPKHRDTTKHEQKV